MKFQLVAMILFVGCMLASSLAVPLLEEGEARAALQKIRTILVSQYHGHGELKAENATTNATSTPSNLTGQCDIPDNNMRINCGYVKSEAQCREKKCCWLLSDVHGVPWCYHKQENAPQCQTNNRVQCGRYDIGAAECEGRGCCWSPLAINGQPWCYHKTGVMYSQ